MTAEGSKPWIWFLLLGVLWLWVIRNCEALAAFYPLLHSRSVVFIISLCNISMERQHVTTETCSSSRHSDLPRVFVSSLIGFIRLSQYESSIRQSFPACYGPVAPYLSYSTKKKLCVKSPLLWLHIPGFSLCQCHSVELEGGSWFMAELQWSVQCFWGLTEAVSV